MSILAKHVDFVNEQISFHINRANFFSENPFRKKKHVETSEHFQQLLNDINKVDELLNTKENLAKDQQPKQLRLSLTPEDIKDLPQEVIDELSTASLDETEFAILSIMEDAGGIMSLDQIIVGLYHQTKKAHKRTAITNKIYRMDKIRSIQTKKGKKGVYALKGLSDEEIEEML